ncbi:MAG: diaminopimelate epimerase [Clostridioides sp.]|jgi:diaminopimelate epimerase|nr:diaminopimelate epimerase [Clostridioides sp.]
MKFWKLHGIGNDFIAIDGRFDGIDSNEYSKLASTVCHRKFSVGADGLLVVKNSDVADVEMVYYNSDGSRAHMCGNGIRCFSKFAYENKIVEKDEFEVYTLDGIKKISLNIVDNKINTIKVDMGKGSFLAEDVPVKTYYEKFITIESSKNESDKISNDSLKNESNKISNDSLKNESDKIASESLKNNSKEEFFIEQEVQVLDKKFKMSSILMGVPHTIIFVDEFIMEDILKYGSAIEKHSIFPEKTNVNFVKVIDKNNIEVRTFERGCGYTFGCGTGMTASAMICKYLGKTTDSVNVSSEGGTVTIDITDENAFMTGPAIKICEGILEL